jgi:hypothetical protein
VRRPLTWNRRSGLWGKDHPVQTTAVTGVLLASLLWIGNLVAGAHHYVTDLVGTLTAFFVASLAIYLIRRRRIKEACVTSLGACSPNYFASKFDDVRCVGAAACNRWTGLRPQPSAIPSHSP